MNQSTTYWLFQQGHNKKPVAITNGFLKTNHEFQTVFLMSLLYKYIQQIYVNVNRWIRVGEKQSAGTAFPDNQRPDESAKGWLGVSNQYNRLTVARSVKKECDEPGMLRSVARIGKSSPRITKYHSEHERLIGS